MTNQAAIKSDDVETLVRERGREDGDAAGSWVIDGNTSKERAREIWQGLQDCDGAILDSLPTLCFGEWADDPSFEEILADLDIEYSEDEIDDLFAVYQDGWSEGMHDRVSRDAMLAMPLSIRLSQSDDDDGMVTVYCDNQEQAKHDQSIDGAHWECPGDMDCAYATVMDRPNLVEDLEREGYDVDTSEYSAPDDEDLAYWTYKNNALNAGEDPLDREDWLAKRDAEYLDSLPKAPGTCPHEACLNARCDGECGQGDD